MPGRSFSHAAISSFRRFSALVLARDRILDRVEAVAHLLGHVLVRLGDHHALRRARPTARRPCVFARKPFSTGSCRPCRVELERALHAVVVRDDQALGRHERARCSRRARRPPRAARSSGSASVFGVELDAHLLEVVDVLRQRHLRRHPHATRVAVLLAEREGRIGWWRRGEGGGRCARDRGRRRVRRRQAGTACDGEGGSEEGGRAERSRLHAGAIACSAGTQPTQLTGRARRVRARMPRGHPHARTAFAQPRSMKSASSRSTIGSGRLLSATLVGALEGEPDRAAGMRGKRDVPGPRLGSGHQPRALAREPSCSLELPPGPLGRGEAARVDSSPGVVSAPSVGDDGHARRLPRQQGRVPHPPGPWLGRLGRRGRPLAVVAAHLLGIL